MPNESLLQQLDSLRVQTTQQQKTAVALQNALKAAVDAQNKVQKSLNDYASGNTGTNISPALDVFSGLALKEQAVDPLLPDLRREVKSLAQLTAALKDAATALQTEPVDVSRLDKALTTLQGVKQPPISDLLPDLMTEFDLAQRALGDEFGARLRDALAEQGVTLGGRGTKFEIGRFELDVNFSQRFMTLRYGRDLVIPRIPVTVDAAVKAYQSALRGIAGRNLDGSAWIAQLYDASQTALRRRGQDSGRINIVDVYVEMVWLRQGRAFFTEPSKRTLTEYTRPQFIYDFHQITDHRRAAHNGLVVRAHIATRSQTDNAAKSMWIVEGDSPYDGRYIADIEFVKD